MTERAALAFELLKCCSVRLPAGIINAILKNMGRYITDESVGRNIGEKIKPA
jgi:hypothetical protein